MRTIVYIDGYNFYFGLLKNTPYKWLDSVALIKHICRIQNPEFDVITVKFFTAPVITRVSSRGDKALQAQNAYHKALITRYPDSLEIISGYHILEKGYPPRYNKPIVKEDRVAVWHLEESEQEINVLKNTEMYELFTTVTETEGMGGDPLGDLAKQIMRQISECKIYLKMVREQKIKEKAL